MWRTSSAALSLDLQPIRRGRMNIERLTAFVTSESRLFKGFVFSFTHVIPHDVRPEAHEQWQKSVYYGARCLDVPSPEATHLIAGAFTDKVREAIATCPGMRIVNQKWVDACIAQVWSQNTAIFSN